jgi:ribosomal protein L7/L12
MDNEASLEARLTRVERQLELLARHIGLDLTSAVSQSGTSPQVLKQVRDGQVIQAIATYRNETGVGLREAKEAVDEIRRQMQSR